VDAIGTDSKSESDGSAAFDPGTRELLYEQRDGIANLTFNRPASFNAMTWAMYQGLYATCEHVDADDSVRVLVLRGSGERAFVAGTDITQFRSLSTAEDFLNYEHTINRNMSRLEAVQKPTIAVLRGACVGGGALIATACDIRVASPDVRFGVPVARTLGNVLSTWGFTRLVAMLGPARTKEIILTARLVEAEEGKSIGLFSEIVPAEGLEARAVELASKIAGYAPLTLRASKEAVRRVVERASPSEFDDLVLSCYLSQDFREGVEAFVAKRSPQWSGH
jgi:enoyl-CoA hydratase